MHSKSYRYLFKALSVLALSAGTAAVLPGSLPTVFNDAPAATAYAAGFTDIPQDGSSVTKQGYVVGAANGSANKVVTGKDDPTLPNSNLVIAESPTTDPAKPENLIFVQLPSQFRDQFAAKITIGKKVEVSGSGEKYFGQIGIKDTTAVKIVGDDPTPPDPDVKDVTILQARTAFKANDTKKVRVTGRITTDIGSWGGKGFYIQDATGGVNVYTTQDLGLSRGDEVTVEGAPSANNNEIQFASPTIKKTSSANQIVAPAKQTSLDAITSDADQGEYVSFDKVTITSDINKVDTYGTSEFTITDEAGKTATVRFDNRAGVTYDDLTKTADGSVKFTKGSVINIAGVVSQYKDAFQLKPTQWDDMHFNDPAEDAAKNPKPKPVGDATIHQIQGRSQRSPLVGKHVSNVVGVVTNADNSKKIYIQTPAGQEDNDPATSEGLLVQFKNDPNLSVGDQVTLDGDVKEVFLDGYSEKTKTDLTTTALTNPVVVKKEAGKVPKPVVIGKDRIIPTEKISSNNFMTFDPSKYTIDFWESLESMQVQVDNPKVIGPEQYNELTVLPSESKRTLNDMGGLTLTKDSYNMDKVSILMTGKNKKDVKYFIGDTFQAPVTGPVTYDYSNYKILSDVDNLPEVTKGNIKPEQTTLTPATDKLSIASYNVENFTAVSSETPDSKVEKLANSFVNDIKKPDVITLMEMQDDSGSANDGVTSSQESGKRLADAIKKAGGPQYTYVDVAPENNQDGGAPGANIRVAYLYNPERVELKNPKTSTSTEEVKWQADGTLNVNPGRLGVGNSDFKSTRKPLVAQFTLKSTNEDFFVIANHLNSKRGDDPVMGQNQPPVFKSETQRHKLATYINQFIKDGMAKNPKMNLIMDGDINDYEFSQTAAILEGNEMTDLVSNHDLKDRFSYFYQGNFQTLDQMFVSNNLKDDATFDMVHINSAFDDEHRASDHDPLHAVISLKEKAVVLNGWHQEGSDWYFYKDNKKVHGWLEDGGSKYYLNPDKDGARVSGWQTIDNARYYFDKDGKMQTGWQTIDNASYYFNQDGVMQTGWLDDGGFRYYLRPSDGAKVTGFQTIDGARYYFDKDGHMMTGWQYLDNAWYYFNNDGKMATGWLNLGGTWYYLNNDGKMATGWVNDGGTWYYMNASGAMTTGWQLVSGTWYYMNASGSMQTGWLKLGSTWYFLNASGSMATGWMQIGNAWYYFNNSGAMTTGWQLVNGTWYYMNASGTMATGWLNDHGTWYFLNASGAMATGWIQVGPTWYYMSTSGKMATGTQTINGKTYRFSSNGDWIG